MWNNSSSSTEDEGFTLLEVIVAFVILSVSLGLLMQGFGSGIKNHTIAEERGEMLIAARNLLAEFGTVRPLKTGSYAGEITGNFSWQANLSTFQSGTKISGLNAFWVRVSVQKSLQNSTSSSSPVSLRTLKLTR